MNKEQINRFNVADIEDWEAISDRIMQVLTDHRVVLLTGDLGAGKTTLVKAIAEKLEIVDQVTSPTYSLVQEYRTVRGEVVYHLDLYRLESYDEVIAAGIEELLDGDYLCAFIEWPELVMGELDQAYVEVHINLSDGLTRDVTISSRKN